jgi:hypothetical protein
LFGRTPGRVRGDEGGTAVAETAKGKKFIRIQGYTRADGTKVPTHDRSTPGTSRGPKREQRKRAR